MPYKIQLFVAGDELSRNTLRVVDKITRVLMERFGPRIKSLSKDYVAYVLTTNTIMLNLKQGASEVVQIEMFFVLETYREELKARFNLMDFPAAKFNDTIYTGRDALEVASRLQEILSRFPNISDDELLAEIKRIVSQERVPESRIVAEVKTTGGVSSSSTRIVQPTTPIPPPTTPKEESIAVVAEKPQLEAESASRSLVDKVLFERNVVRAGIAECLAKLERLREEGRIDENTYRKMKEVYDSFLS